MYKKKEKENLMYKGTDRTFICDCCLEKKDTSILNEIVIGKHRLIFCPDCYEEFNRLYKEREE